MMLAQIKVHTCCHTIKRTVWHRRNDSWIRSCWPWIFLYFFIPLR